MSVLDASGSNFVPPCRAVLKDIFGSHHADEPFGAAGHSDLWNSYAMVGSEAERPLKQFKKGSQVKHSVAILWELHFLLACVLTFLTLVFINSSGQQRGLSWWQRPFD